MRSLVAPHRDNAGERGERISSCSDCTTYKEIEHSLAAIKLPADSPQNLLFITNFRDRQSKKHGFNGCAGHRATREPSLGISDT
jgi:hypothetical protein